MSLPADLLPLCTSVPPDKRPIAQAYIWTSASPLLRLPEPMFSPTVDKLAERFAVRAIEAQPLDYARAVWDDTVRSFEWNRSVFPNPDTYDAYLFGYQSHVIPVTPYRGYPSAAAYYVRGNPATVIVSPFAQVIRGYQRYVWLPGTVYGLILLVGLFGIARRWRRRGKRGAAPLAVLARACRGARGDGGVRLPLRHHRGPVRLPSRRDGVRHGGPHAPRRERRPGRPPGRRRPRQA